MYHSRQVAFGNYKHVRAAIQAIFMPQSSVWSLGPPGAPTIDEESLDSSVQAKLQTVQALASADTAVANHTQNIKSQFPGTIVMW